MRKKKKKDAEALNEMLELVREKLIKHFEKTAFNQCENQKLNLLERTKMDVIIKEGANPKRTMKPIPCPWNLRGKAKKDLDMGEKM